MTPFTLTPTVTTGTPSEPGTGVVQPTSQSYLRSGFRWEQVTVPVTNPPENAFLRITATRTLQTDPATTAGSGWLCGAPVIDWFDLDLFATSTISCLYAGKGDGGPILLDYQVAPGSLLTVTLTPPSGYPDPDPSDNQRQLVLRDDW